MFFSPNELSNLRGMTEDAMVDTAVFTRPGGAPVFDPVTGQLEPAAGTVIFTGPCRLRQPTAQESEVLFGEEQITVSRFVACVPHDAEAALIGDVVTFTVSDDPAVLLRSFRVVAVPLATFTIYKGYAVEAIE